jgi:hypothetical protein
MPSSSNVETEEEDNGATLLLTLLLASGARHPFKIDGRYLQKRAVSVPDNDPYAMSVYTLKELILREWRSGMGCRRVSGSSSLFQWLIYFLDAVEWEPRPSSPSMIRLISLGKLLDDKAPLSGMQAGPSSDSTISVANFPFQTRGSIAKTPTLSI